MLKSLFTSAASASEVVFAPRLWQQQQTVRHRGKFNMKIPRPRHEIARFLEDITRPMIVKEIPDPTEKCTRFKERTARNLKFTTKQASEYELFLAKYVQKLLDANPVMLICHKLDCHGEIFRRNQVEFKKNDTIVRNFNRTVMNLLIENNPKYKNLEPIVENALGRNYYMFSQEKNLNKNLLLIRRIPHIVLLGGMINDRLLTKNGIQEYVNLPDLDTLRGQLVGLLNNQLALVPTTLAMPLARLSGLLGEHGKSLQLKSASSAPADDSSSTSPSSAK